jgi:hypothetical protein
VNDLELENQTELLRAAFSRGVREAGKIADEVIIKSTPIVYEKGLLCGFWYGFAAGAFGVMLALGITYLIYS